MGLTYGEDRLKVGFNHQQDKYLKVPQRSKNIERQK